MSTDDLEDDLTRRTENAPQELATRSFFFLCAALSIATTLSIVVLLTTEAAKFFDLTAPLMDVTGETVSIVQFLTGTEWNIQGEQFGVLALVSATILVTVGSAVVAIPLGTATAIYLSEYASPELRSLLKPALEILAGVPTVVYGFFALKYVTPALKVFFPSIEFFNLASASILVGILIIPMVASISEDAMSAVPDELRQAGYGMGATKFEVSTGIVVPAAISGIISSFILAISRAIGETMIVVVAAGSQAKFLPLLPSSYLDGALPMTAAMVKLLTGDITGGGLAYRSLFAIGLTLFFITLAMNVISDLIARHYREEY
ncbi:phosphate ABC transporter permease subunit PstC [Halobium palmae]|uniref:Phosphate transport system permease protein n=1 Tax=Halobium palmae TaxID=1776492 RepID=A0ABD5RY61_9EURY